MARITKLQRTIRLVCKHGNKRTCDVFVFWFSYHQTNKFVITIPAKLGNAVTRNFWRRQIKEYCRKRWIFHNTLRVLRLNQIPENKYVLYKKLETTLKNFSE